MKDFTCYRCHRVLPCQAKYAPNLDFCRDCRRSDLKDAEPYFRNGQWKELPRFLKDIEYGILKEH